MKIKIFTYVSYFNIPIGYYIIYNKYNTLYNITHNPEI